MSMCFRAMSNLAYYRQHAELIGTVLAIILVLYLFTATTRV